MFDQRDQRVRPSMPGPPHPAPPRLNDYAAAPFGQNLDPAGEQFIEQTPWANPRHPSHQIVARPQQIGPHNGPPPYSYQASAAPQQADAGWLAHGQPNGVSARKHPAAAAADPDIGQGRRTAEALKSK